MKLDRKTIPPIIFMLMGYAYDLLYHLKYGKLMLDSDMSAEMILANMLNEERSILSTDWFYSSEIRVFETQWFYRIGLILFPHNWHLARTFAMGLCLAVLALGIYLCCRAARLGVYGLWITACSMWPIGFWYSFQFTYGGFYTPYAIFSFYSLFCIISLINKPDKPTPYIVALVLLSYASGLNGIRQLMIFFAPVLLAAVLMIKPKEIVKGHISENILYTLGYSLLGFVANILGYLTNMLVLTRFYFFETQSQYAFGEGSGSWLTSIKWLIEMYGYCQHYKMAYFDEPQSIPLFSFNGIAAGCGLVVGLLVLASAIYLMIIYKKLSYFDRFLTTITLSMVFVISFVFTYLWGAMQYWMQTLPFGYVLLALAIKNLPGMEGSCIINTEGETDSDVISFPPSVKKITDFVTLNCSTIIFVMIGVLMAVSSKGTVASSVENPFRNHPGLENVVSWIQENTDYTKGCAEFWSSNLVTELSNGEIEMFSVGWPYDPQDLYLWLQKISHEKDFEKLKHYFVLCEYDEEKMNSSVLVDLLDSQLLYNDGTYVVYGVE